MAKPFPLKTLFSRSHRKWLAKYVYGHGIEGARPLKKVNSGNVLLKLSRKSALGDQGFNLQIPKDKNMYLTVCKTGVWELQDSCFLASVLSENLKNRTVLVDIGANVGLITLQVNNLIDREQVDYFLVEPRKHFFEALTYNLREVQKDRIRFFNAALSDFSGEAELFSEVENLGNSSLISDAMPSLVPGAVQKEKVQVLDALSFFQI